MEGVGGNGSIFKKNFKVTPIDSYLLSPQFSTQIPKRKLYTPIKK